MVKYQQLLKPENRKREFHVCIIESPNDNDFYEGKFEGEILSKILRLLNISSTHRLAVNKKQFIKAITEGLIEDLKKFKKVPIIHISAHGDENGIQLTNGNIIPWGDLDLKKKLKIINKNLEGKLILSMSSCKGTRIYKIVLGEETDLPFYAVVGCNEDVGWDDTIIAFATYYHLFAKGKKFKEIQEGIQKASGNKNFVIVGAETVREVYKNCLGRQKQSKLK